MDFTAIIRKGEKQFVALCPELDVVSQGYTVEDAISNLREACELYIEEMGVPEGATSEETIVASFEVKQDGRIGVVVPTHKEIDKGTLIEIIRQAGLKRDEFLKLV
jgi:predicted RNase H-like HicB family nuclease